MKYKELHTPTPFELIALTVCDFCGSEIRDGYGFDASEVTIRAAMGSVYPECDDRQFEEFDCCTACWAKKVAPALEALGGRRYSYDVDEGRKPKARPISERKGVTT